MHQPAMKQADARRTAIVDDEKTSYKVPVISDVLNGSDRIL